MEPTKLSQLWNWLPDRARILSFLKTPRNDDAREGSYLCFCRVTATKSAHNQLNHTSTLLQWFCSADVTCNWPVRSSALTTTKFDLRVPSLTRSNPTTWFCLTGVGRGRDSRVVSVSDFDARGPRFQSRWGQRNLVMEFVNSYHLWVAPLL